MSLKKHLDTVVEVWKFEICHAGEALNQMDQERDHWGKAMDQKHAEYVLAHKAMEQGWTSLEMRFAGLKTALSKEKKKTAILEAQASTLVDCICLI